MCIRDRSTIGLPISCKRSPTKPKAGSSAGRWTKPAFQDPPAWTGLVRPEPRCAASVWTVSPPLFHDPWLGASTRAILHGRADLAKLRSLNWAFRPMGDERQRGRAGVMTRLNERDWHFGCPVGIIALAKNRRSSRGFSSATSVLRH